MFFVYYNLKGMATGGVVQITSARWQCTQKGGKLTAVNLFIFYSNFSLIIRNYDIFSCSGDI